MSNTPAASAPNPYKRKVSNYLLDARFQLKFASYIVLTALILTAALGIFLYRTTDSLFAQAQQAVEARQKVAEISKDLGSCALNNDIARNMDNPDFEAQMTARSAALDKNFENAQAASRAERLDLIAQQRMTAFGLIGGLFAFIVFLGFGTIVTTHRIVGPLFRVKRMANEVAAGKVRPPTYGLRPGDELKDLFDAFANMVTRLRETQEAELKRVEEALAAAKNGSAEGAAQVLEALRGGIKERLDR